MELRSPGERALSSGTQGEKSPDDNALHVPEVDGQVAEGEDGERDEEPDAASAPEDSVDEDWSEDSALSSPSDDDGGDGCERRAVSFCDDEMEQAVAGLIDADDCEAKCLEGKEQQLQVCLLSLQRLGKEQRRVSLMTALAVLKEADVAERHRGYGLRDRFAYYLPMVGRVCRQSFCQVYNVAPATVKRLRRLIKDGSFAPKEHGGRQNKNASTLDVTWLVDWFKGFADQVAEVVPVRVRRQSTVDGMAKHYYSPVDFYLLPAYFTWATLHKEMLNFIAEKELSVREPALATMRQLLTKHCPNVRIRSARSNVCDVCAIYHARMKSSTPTDLTEAFGKHTLAARRMRVEYQNDLESADDNHAVVIMDYSQNLTLPSVSTTPSQWYFLSLWSVNMFGIYFANDKIQYNYLYEESTANKGSDEVVSMLHHFIKVTLLPRGFTKLTIYADNCTGQNKNNFVVKFLLALTHMGDLEEVALKFFIKGHTKNAVDRGFGHIRKKLAREDVYTMNQLVQLVDHAASSSATVHLGPEMNAFKNYKLVLADAYKNVPAIRKYQVFTMKDSSPGTARCFVDPDGDPVVCDLRKRYDGIETDDTRVRTMFQVHLNPIDPPALNSEKIITMHTKVRPYVPVEFQDDPLYAAPTAEQEKTAKTIKVARSGARKAATTAALPEAAPEKAPTGTAVDDARETEREDEKERSVLSKRRVEEAHAKSKAPTKQRAKKYL